MTMKNNPFLDVMRQHSNEELLLILGAKRADYVADAIAAAEEVLGERGVAFEKKPDEEFVQEKAFTSMDSIKASAGTRLLGFFIDSVVIFILTIVVLKFAGAAGNVINNLVIDVSYYVLFFLYCIVLESADGNKTLGKRILKMRVVDERGEMPTSKSILIRTLCRFIPFDAISYIMGWNWHDSLSKTYVVHDDKLKKFKEQRLE